MASLLSSLVEKAIVRGSPFFAIGFLLLLPRLASAQAPGTIPGLVTDPSNAVLPRVAVEAANTATGLVRASTSGPDSIQVVPPLPPGVCDVKAALAGFAPWISARRS